VMPKSRPIIFSVWGSLPSRPNRLLRITFSFSVRALSAQRGLLHFM
jgi:hypothetical protein